MGDEDHAEVARAAMPTAVRQLADAPFAADGQIHVQRRGTFAIRPETNFCTSRPGLGLDGSTLSEALEKIGQSAYLNGSIRLNGVIGPPPDCEGANPILVAGFQSDNREGKPYKLVLTVWQGAGSGDGAGVPTAVWVGRIERLDGWRADNQAGPRSDKSFAEVETEASIIKDLQDLNARFASAISGEEM